MSSFAAFVVAGIVSVFFLLAAAGTADLPRALLLLLGGGVSGAIGLYIINRPISALAHSRPLLWALVGTALMAAGGALVLWAFSIESGALAAIAMIAVMLGSLPVGSWLRTSRLPVPGLWVLVGLVLVVFGGLVIGRFMTSDSEPDGLFGVSRIVGAAVALSGLGLVKIGLPQWLDRERAAHLDRAEERVNLVLAVGLGAAIGGVVAMPMAASIENLGMFLAGFAIAALGLTAFALAGFASTPRLSAGGRCSAWASSWLCWGSGGLGPSWASGRRWSGW